MNFYKTMSYSALIAAGLGCSGCQDRGMRFEARWANQKVSLDASLAPLRFMDPEAN